MARPSGLIREREVTSCCRLLFLGESAPGQTWHDPRYLVAPIHEPSLTPFHLHVHAATRDVCEKHAGISTKSLACELCGYL